TPARIPHLAAGDCTPVPASQRIVHVPSARPSLPSYPSLTESNQARHHSPHVPPPQP
ncbi:hypothetical protein DAEQUDRAFT_734228, partial [Daedalea quercina L-15889]